MELHSYSVFNSRTVEQLLQTYPLGIYEVPNQIRMKLISPSRASDYSLWREFKKIFRPVIYKSPIRIPDFNSWAKTPTGESWFVFKSPCKNLHQITLIYIEAFDNAWHLCARGWGWSWCYLRCYMNTHFAEVTAILASNKYPVKSSTTESLQETLRCPPVTKKKWN